MAKKDEQNQKQPPKQNDTATRTRAKKAAMLQALQKTLGIINEAAKFVGIGRATHYRWIEDDPEYKEAVDAIGEAAIDFVESKLFQLIDGVKLPDTKLHVMTVSEKQADGTFRNVQKVVATEIVKHYPPNEQAVTFYLATKGKKRGYDKEAPGTPHEEQPLFPD